MNITHKLIPIQAANHRPVPTLDYRPISSEPVSAKHDVNSHLLTHDGSLVLVGLPPEPLEINAFNVVMGRRSFSGSNIGGIAETQEMFAFCAERKIAADIELITVDEVNTAFERLEKGDVKYRFVVDMSSLK